MQNLEADFAFDTTGGHVVLVGNLALSLATVCDRKLSWHCAFLFFPTLPLLGACRMRWQHSNLRVPWAVGVVILQRCQRPSRRNSAGAAWRHGKPCFASYSLMLT